MNNECKARGAVKRLRSLRVSRFFVYVFLVLDILVLATWILVELFPESVISQSLVMTLEEIVMFQAVMSGGIFAVFLGVLEIHAEIEKELMDKISELEQQVK